MEVVFEELFEKNNWQPMSYKGKCVFIGDDFKVPIGKSLIEYDFVEVNSHWEQGVFFKGKGTFLIDGEEFKSGIYLWQGTAPKIGELEYHSKDGILKVWNIWKIDGRMHYGHNGAAMYSEDIPYGKRYFCNDGYPDDDFNDLIFTLKIIPQKT